MNAAARRQTWFIQSCKRATGYFLTAAFFYAVFQIAIFLVSDEGLDWLNVPEIEHRHTFN